MKLPYALARLRRQLLEARAERLFAGELARNRAMARPGPTELVVVLDHLFPLMNPGIVVRTAEAFGARELHLVGMRFFDPGSAVGTVPKVPLRFFDTLDASVAVLAEQRYEVFALAPPETGRAARALGEASMPARTALIVGNERFGLSVAPEALPGVHRLTIRQCGSVQSLNAAVATSLAVYEYDRQRRLREPTTA